MTRICVLGNSHAACFKLAWEEIKASYPDTTLTFFAHRGAELAALAPRGTALVPTNPGLRDAITHTSGGEAVVDLAAYDAALMIGLNIRLYPILPGHVSDALVRQWLREYLPATFALDLVDKIRTISSIPVFFAHQPLEACIVKEVNHPPAAYRAYAGIAAEIFQHRGAVLFEQPAKTITNHHFTKQTYLVGAKRLDVGDLPTDPHPDADRTHMNKQFGTVCLSEFLPTMLGLPALAIPAHEGEPAGGRAEQIMRRIFRPALSKQ